MDDDNGKEQVEDTTTEEKNAQRSRGRPRKEENVMQNEAICMKNYLEKGKITGFEIEFGSRKRMEHSPVRTRSKMDEKEALELDNEGEDVKRRHEEAGQYDAIAGMSAEATLDKVSDEDAEGSRKRDAAEARLPTQTEEGIAHMRERQAQRSDGIAMSSLKEATVGEGANETKMREAAAGTCGDQEQTDSEAVMYASLKEWMNGRMREMVDGLDEMNIENPRLVGGDE